MKRASLTGLCGLFLLAAHAVFAQSYPERPIRMVIPFSSGGSIDTTARRIVAEWTELLGQQIVVDNRGGAGGTIGTEIVARATPDGYTILYANLGPLSIGPHLYKKLGYDVFKDLAPVSHATNAPFILFSSTKLPVKTVQELIAYAKAQPKQLNYASSGVGSGLHLTTELFAGAAGIEIVHVPFKGIGQAIPQLAGGQLHVLAYPYAGAISHIKAGRIRPLVTAAERRSPVLPDVPTSAEVGLPSFVSTAWHAIVAPHGTPRAVVDKLQKTFAAALEKPELRAIMDMTDVQLVGSSPAELGRFLRTENDKWRNVIRSAGISLN
ncbi:MAG: tripartite tricarboxylate transporter substrate binding protein [Betaproteobacteria bacterium]|nr:tripartite tricarboxylate transporter substrate binding protein [Betaproteobacteria bacterium]